MSRTVAEINQQILTNLVTNFDSINITIDPTKWSKRNILRQICWTVATAQAYTEQLMDTMKSEIDTSIRKSRAGSKLWLQEIMFKFQYSDTTVQQLTIIDGVETYPIVDETLQIITACSVSVPSTNTVILKVAKNNPLESLTTPELTAAQGYIDLRGTAGVNYTVRSVPADEIMIEAYLYYNKSYASTIVTDTKNAINSFFLNMSITNFDGTLFVSDIEKTLKQVTGMVDVVMLSMSARASTTSWAMRTDLVVSSQVVKRDWLTIAGYCKTETMALHTIDDTLHFFGQ